MAVKYYCDRCKMERNIHEFVVECKSFVIDEIHIHLCASCISVVVPQIHRLVNNIEN